MFKKILVPLDGSELAERALPPAQVIAGQAEQLILLNVPVAPPIVSAALYPHDTSLSGISAQQLQAQGANYLSLKKAEFLTNEIAIKAEVISGDPASVIVDAAVAEEVDLIIMSTHGYSGLDRFIMGSVTQRVLRHAPCPVMVIRKRGVLERVMITLDGSELAEAAVEPGLELADQFEAMTTFLRVKEPQSQPNFELVTQLEGIEAGFGEHLLEDYYGSVDSYLVKQQLQYADDRPIATATAYGDPVEAIIRHVQSEHINLLVMATHGRTGLNRWVYGSVAEKVLQRVDCAVLLIRP